MTASCLDPLIPTERYYIFVSKLHNGTPLVALT